MVLVWGISALIFGIWSILVLRVDISILAERGEISPFIYYGFDIYLKSKIL